MKGKQTSGGWCRMEQRLRVSDTKWKRRKKTDEGNS